jgi:hypothetical protein
VASVHLEHEYQIARVIGKNAQVKPKRTLPTSPPEWALAGQDLADTRAFVETTLVERAHASPSIRAAAIANAILHAISHRGGRRASCSGGIMSKHGQVWTVPCWR